MAGEQHAGLTVTFVDSLDGIVEPAIGFLSARADGRDLFAPDHIIVPNAGVRAWLLHKLASTLGQTGNRGDGIVANVEVGYLGLLRTVAGGPRDDRDPWAVDPLTFAVLECLPEIPQAKSLIGRYNGALRAARVIADRFDSYHVRRPHMIDAWESGNAQLAPELGRNITGDEWEIVDPPLDPEDAWQFHLWTRVQRRIDQPGPPAQMRAMIESLRSGTSTPTADRLAVLGLQSIPPQMLELLKVVATRIEVRVVLVHPSPVLHRTWADNGVDLTGSNSILPLRTGESAADQDVHPLLSSWLQGSREAQAVLRAAGVDSTFAAPTRDIGAASLLGHIQESVRSAPQMTARKEGFPDTDTSIQIHRAHDLSRQVEILRDVLLHQFAEVQDLEPHDVVILCPDMNSAAPLLTAAFDRELTVRTRAGETRKLRIPLVVADRGLREISDGARVLADLLDIVGSRVSRTGLLALFAQRPVLESVGLGPDSVELWSRILDRVGVQWGLDQSHRARKGVAPEVGATYTWRAAIEQILLGALLPDAAPTPELGGVLPLDDIDTADIPAVEGLVHLVGVVEQLESTLDQRHDLGAWCALVEEALIGLCGRGSVLAEPLKVLRSLVESAVLVPVEDPVPFTFSEFAGLVTERVESIPGRQPLRTGAVTATSLIPLRSVPFKVVCVLGYDDAAINVSEFESDDLGQRQRFIGDPDPRIDSRRAFLDAFLAARDTFVVLCNGRSIKNNAPLPFVTPLAEFVDMTVDAGARHWKDGDTDRWQIVHDHPRHAVSAANFAADGVMSGRVFGHLVEDLEASAVVGSTPARPRIDVRPLTVEPDARIAVNDLVKVVTDPGDFYLRSLGIPTWRESASADRALLPFDLSPLHWSIIWNERFGHPSPKGSIARDSMLAPLRARGVLPVGKLGEKVLDDLDHLHGLMHDEAVAWGATGVNTDSCSISCVLDATTVSGDLRFSRAGDRIVLFDRKEPKNLNVLAAVTMLLLEIDGRHFDEAVLIGVDEPDEEGTPTIAVKVLDWKNPLSPDDARFRLDGLIGAIRSARSVPMFPFGTTVSKLTGDKPWAEIESAFDAFVRSDKFPGSKERIVFGDAPAAGEILNENGPVASAWRLLASALTLTNVGGRKKSYPDRGGDFGRSRAS